ncbi:MAG TPA: YceI family protein [Flavobacteriales bacterium]|nr:YceI family protein [Flavobacteriales bacterium]
MNSSRTLIAVLALVPAILFAQSHYGTRAGSVTFFSSTPVEDIEAANNAAACVFDVSSGAVEVSMLMRGFTFKKAKMQEDFNEDFVESATYPKCLLKGTVSGLDTKHLKQAGTYPVKVEGDLTLHGVTQHVALDAEITVEEAGGLLVASDFIIKPEDYKINVPALVREKIAREIQVKVRMKLEAL